MKTKERRDKSTQHMSLWYILGWMIVELRERRQGIEPGTWTELSDAGLERNIARLIKALDCRAISAGAVEWFTPHFEAAKRGEMYRRVESEA